MCKISLLLFNLVWRLKICDNFFYIYYIIREQFKMYWWTSMVQSLSFDILWHLFFFFFWMKRWWVCSTKWGFERQGVSRDRDGGRHTGDGFRWHIAIWEWGRLSNSSLDILVIVVGTFPWLLSVLFSFIYVTYCLLLFLEEGSNFFL